MPIVGCCVKTAATIIPSLVQDRLRRVFRHFTEQVPQRGPAQTQARTVYAIEIGF